MTLNEGLEHAGTYLVTSTPFNFNIPPSRYVTIAEFAQVISAQPA